MMRAFRNTLTALLLSLLGVAAYAQSTSGVYEAVDLTHNTSEAAEPKTRVAQAADGSYLQWGPYKSLPEGAAAAESPSYIRYVKADGTIAWSIVFEGNSTVMDAILVEGDANIAAIVAFSNQAEMKAVWNAGTEETFAAPVEGLQNAQILALKADGTKVWNQTFEGKTVEGALFYDDPLSSVQLAKGADGIYMGISHAMSLGKGDKTFVTARFNEVFLGCFPEYTVFKLTMANGAIEGDKFILNATSGATAEDLEGFTYFYSSLSSVRLVSMPDNGVLLAGTLKGKVKIKKGDAAAEEKDLGFHMADKEKIDNQGLYIYKFGGYEKIYKQEAKAQLSVDDLLFYTQNGGTQIFLTGYYTGKLSLGTGMELTSTAKQAHVYLTSITPADGSVTTLQDVRVQLIEHFSSYPRLLLSSKGDGGDLFLALPLSGTVTLGTTTHTDASGLTDEKKRNALLVQYEVATTGPKVQGSYSLLSDQMADFSAIRRQGADEMALHGWFTSATPDGVSMLGDKFSAASAEKSEVFTAVLTYPSKKVPFSVSISEGATLQFEGPGVEMKEMTGTDTKGVTEVFAPSTYKMTLKFDAALKRVKSFTVNGEAIDVKHPDEPVYYRVAPKATAVKVELVVEDRPLKDYPVKVTISGSEASKVVLTRNGQATTFTGLPTTYPTMTVDSGDELKVEATPASGYELVSLKVNGETKSSGDVIPITEAMSDGVTVDVVFKSNQTPVTSEALRGARLIENPAAGLLRIAGIEGKATYQVLLPTGAVVATGLYKGEGELRIPVKGVTGLVLIRLVDAEGGQVVLKGLLQ